MSAAQVLSRNGTARSAPFLPLFVICLLVLGYQGRDMLLSPQLWGEDGPVFFQQQLGHAWPRLFQPYAGYLHFVPRIVTWMSHIVSVKHQPAFMNTSAWLIAAWAFAFTARRLDRHVPAWVSLAIIAFAPTSGEINGNITNIQWFLQFALFALVFVPPIRPARAWLSFTLTVVLALTGPFSIVFSALIIALLTANLSWPRVLRSNAHEALRAWLRQLSRSALVGLLVGALVQVVTLVAATDRTGANADWIRAAGDLMGTILPIHIVGEPILPPRAWGLIYLILGVMLFTGSEKRIEAAMCVAVVATAGVGLALAGLIVLPRPYNLSFGFSDRYYLFARIGFWWVVYTAFANHWKDRLHAGTATVLLAGFVGLVISPGLHRRWEMPPLNWEEHVRIARQPGHHCIPINPGSTSIEITTDASGKMIGGPASQ